MLIGWGVDVAVRVGAVGVIVKVGVEVNIFVAVAVSVGDINVIAGTTFCRVAQAVVKRAIFIKTNIAFFITEFLIY